MSKLRTVLKENPRFSTILNWVFIVSGVLLRLKAYLVNRSLWWDECRLTVNLVERSFGGLTQPLAEQQGAPIGFLWIEKAFTQALGYNEYALRLFPLLCGIISIFLFYKVARHYLDHRAVPLAVFLFSFSKGLVYYSAETKQYSFDIAVCLLLYILAIYIQKKGLNIPRTILLMFAGAAAVWCSHPAVFVLTGIGVAIALPYFLERRWKSVFCLAAVCLAWLLSFAVNYAVSLDKLLRTGYLLNFWKDTFISFPPNILNISDGFSEFFRHFFSYIFFADTAMLVFFIGCAAMFLKRKKDFLILILPVIIVMAVSVFRLYPFRGRMLLFMAPLLLIFIAYGADELRRMASGTIPAVSVIVIGLLCAGPFYEAFFNIESTITISVINFNREGIKPVMDYLKTHKEDEDAIYVYSPGFLSFRYYAPKYGINMDDVMKSAEYGCDWAVFVKDLDRIWGRKRVWVFFSDTWIQGGFDEEKFILYSLDSMGGKRLDSFKNAKAAVYLYDLSLSAAEE